MNCSTASMPSRARFTTPLPLSTQPTPDRGTTVTTTTPSISRPSATTRGFGQSSTVFPNQTAGSDVRARDTLAIPTPPATPTLTPVANRAFGTLNLFDPNFRQPYVMQMNLTVQREVFRNTVLEVGYVSNRGIKLLLDQNVNQTRIYGGFLNDFKELQLACPASDCKGPPLSA